LVELVDNAEEGGVSNDMHVILVRISKSVTLCKSK
jgi:hypothetical protein